MTVSNSTKKNTILGVLSRNVIIFFPMKTFNLILTRCKTLEINVKKYSEFNSDLISILKSIFTILDAIFDLNKIISFFLNCYQKRV